MYVGGGGMSHVPSGSAMCLFLCVRALLPLYAWLLEGTTKHNSLGDGQEGVTI